MQSVHKSVLLNETVEGLNLKNGQSVLDGTFGGGGHSAEICKKYSGITIIGLDKDNSAWSRAKEKFTGLDCKVLFNEIDFRNLDKALEKENINQVDAILLDLGLSSDELENSGRGFSFMKPEPLLMTMKENPQAEDLTAKEIVNTWAEESLADIIYGYGEERYARRIAKVIVENRKLKEINTTFDLVSIIDRAVPKMYKKGKIHFATRTFQGIRIAVNDELNAISEGLEKGFKVLNSGGRMAVISFHSLEDRIIKRFFKDKADKKEGILINKKPIISEEIELKENKRARSAKLRIIEKI